MPVCVNTKVYIVVILCCNMSKTTIQVDSETLLKLKLAKITKRESYDEIINRALNHVKDKS